MYLVERERRSGLANSFVGMTKSGGDDDEASQLTLKDKLTRQGTRILLDAHVIIIAQDGLMKDA